MYTHFLQSTLALLTAHGAPKVQCTPDPTNPARIYPVIPFIYHSHVSNGAQSAFPPMVLTLLVEFVGLGAMYVSNLIGMAKG